MERRASLSTVLLPLLALTALLLSSCSGRFPPHNPLPDLHLPGVTQVPGVTTLQHGVGRGIITGLATAPSLDPAATPRAVIAVDDELYDIGLDGSLPQQILTTCVDRHQFSVNLTVSADGRWLYCNGHGFTIGPFASINVAPPEHTVQLQTETGEAVRNLFNQVAVSPDGRYLALVTDEILGCAIAFYAVAPTYDAAKLVGVLPIAALLRASTPTQCDPFAPSWSPDRPGGPWLAFALCDASCAIEGVPLRSYLDRLVPTAAQPAMLSLDAAQVVYIAGAPRVRTLVWTYTSDSLQLNYLPTDDGKTIWQASLTNESPRLLLALPTDVPGHLSALAATPDGAKLVFAHTRTLPGLCPECQEGETPSHLYYFTPV
jgi:hypothetical protein